MEKGKSISRNSPGQCETKYILTNPNFAVNTTGAVLLLNGCSRGDDVSYRDGRQIAMTECEARLELYPDASAAVSQYARLFIVYDKEARGAAPTFAELFNGASVTAPYNRDNLHRFVFVYDHMFAFGGQNFPPAAIEKRIKLSRLPVQYNSGDTAGVTDIVGGSLYIGAVGTQVSGTTDCQLTGFVQVLFQDL